MKTLRWLSACWWALALLALPATQAAAQNQTQTCIDNAVIACFDRCDDPLNFQECLVGCAAGGYASTQLCSDECFNNPICESNCMRVAERAQICVGATQKVDIVRGALALNRSTGVWQQTVRLTNNTPLETLSNLVLVLDTLAPGWSLANADGTTVDLAPFHSPYKEAAGKLAPGQSVTLVLRFARTGTPTFSYAPVVYTTLTR